MALSQKEIQQAKGFAIFLAVVAVGCYYYFLWNPARIATAPPAAEDGLIAQQAKIDTLRMQIDAIRAQLSSGALEDVEAQIARREAQLDLMRQLVPSANDVPNLLDTISSRAVLRDVELGNFQRVSQEPGALFDVLRYRLVVVGRYDRVGEFLADVASLPRIMVPYDVELTPAPAAQARLYGDTTGALLQATLNLRTFVKRTEGAQ